MSDKTIAGIVCLVLAYFLAHLLTVVAGILLVLGIGFGGWGIYEDLIKSEKK